MRKKAIFALLTTVFVVFAIEGLFRLYVVYFVPEPVVPQHIKRFDERLGWALVKGARGSSSRTGSRIDYVINSKGLRDDETPYAKAPDTYRVVLIGDSRTFGFGVPIKGHFSVLLEDYFENLEVVNLGVGGYGVDQELLFLQDEGVRYRPDLVVAYVAHYANHRHMHDRRWGRWKPRFRLEGDQLVLTNTLASEAKGIANSLHAWLTRHVSSYVVLKSQATRLLKTRRKVDSEADAENDSNPEFVTAMRELGGRIVEEMAEVASHNDARFLLVTQIPHLHERITARGIPSLNVKEALGGKTFQISRELKHVNELGNAVLAREIARFLDAEAWLPESQGSKVESR